MHAQSMPLFIFQTAKTANEGARLCFIYFVAPSFLLSSLQRGSWSWDTGHSSCEMVKLGANVAPAVDLRNPCTSLVVLVMNYVNARSLDKEEKSPTHRRQHEQHLTHMLSFLSLHKSPFQAPLSLSAGEVFYTRKHQFRGE